MRILITGGSGFVGWNAVRYFVVRGHDIVATYRSLSHYLHQLDGCRAVSLDLANGTAIEEVVARFQPDVILHAAALARPQLDRDEEQLHTVNVTGTELLARAAAARDIPIIYLSTDLVFPSDAGRCDEQTPVAPSGAGGYSRTKLLGEDAVRSVASRWIIIRPSLMYGNGTPTSNSFTQFLDRKWDAGEAAPVFTDQIRSFLFVDDLCSAVERAVEAGAWGELFVCGGDEPVSRAEFAMRYAKVRGIDPALCAAMRADDLPGYVGGPSDIRVDSAKLMRLGWRPTLLDEAFERIVAARG
jgi:dTDP-4-dehydrorhamnose reductase